MSRTKSGRMNQAVIGNNFHPDPACVSTDRYTAEVSGILRRLFGNTRHAAKRLARMTGANDRAVRNWMDGANGPHGKHLIQLMRESDEVFAEICRMAGRGDVADKMRAETMLNELEAILKGRKGEGNGA